MRNFVALVGRPRRQYEQAIKLLKTLRRELMKENAELKKLINLYHTSLII